MIRRPAGTAPPQVRRRLFRVQRLLGAIAVVTGTVLLTSATRLDVVLATFSLGHGLDLSDVLGAGAVLAGVVALWTAPPPGC
jgi:hypothetical protein